MKKIGLIALALVLSLGLLGVGLAQWTETLTINGSVATGNLNVEFSPCLCEDNEEALGFDVGTCTCSINTNPDGDLNTDDETLVITIDNAYPCYTCTVDFDVTNTGSIPVDLSAVSLSGVPSELDVTVSVQTTADDLAVGASQVGQLTIHVKDSAAESSTYTFTATILAEQFNP